MKAIQDHLRNVEKSLRLQADWPNISHHNGSRGLVRENFIREFLLPNSPTNIKVLSGGIIVSTLSRSGNIDLI